MANGEIRQRRRQEAQFGPAGFGADPVGSLSGILSILGQLAQNVPASVDAFAGPAASAGAKVGKETGKEFGFRFQTPEQMLAEQAQKVALAKEKERLTAELDQGATTPEQVLQTTQAILNSANQGQVIPGGEKFSQGLDESSANSLAQLEAFSRGEGQINQGNLQFDQSKALNFLSNLVFGITGQATPAGAEAFAKAKAKGAAEGAEPAKTRELKLAGQIDILKESVKGGQEQLKAERERATKFFDDVLRNKPLSGEAATKVGLVESALSSLDAIDALFTQDPNNLKNFNRPGNALGQQLKFVRDDLENSLLRIESGAAISEGEKKFVRELTTPQGVQAYLEDPKTTRLKIETIRKKLDSFRNSLKPNENIRQMAQQLLQKEFSEEEIFGAFKRKGLIV